MGKLNLDELLKDLGDPDPHAPVEPGDNPGRGFDEPTPEVQHAAPLDTASANSVEPSSDRMPSASANVAPEPQQVDQASGNPIFVRTDPKEIPRPPDVSGTGLGREVDPTLATRSAHPARIRPDDALTELYTPDTIADVATPDALANTLIKRGIIKPEQLATAQRVQKQTPGKTLASILIESGADEPGVQQIVAEHAGLPFERVHADQAEAYDYKTFQRLGPEFCKQHLVLPLRREGNRLVVGTTRPDDVFLLDDVRRRAGSTAIKHVLITGADVRAVLDAVTEANAEDYNVDEFLTDVDEDDVAIVEEKVQEAGVEEADSSPVVRYVNHIIQTAMKEGASDIHIEPEEKSLKVRFRIDGVLFESMNPPRKMHAPIISRIKIMANLDIAERRLPQDGRIRVTVLGRKLDLRVSTVPTPKGEKAVMRILDNRSINVSLDDLGFGPETLTLWKNQVDQPHGILMVTGPTGSGKTTTLYASIKQMDLRKLNVSTVEDPVEYNLGNITQIQTHEKIGMTFARALKALLRQDPDVIMVGEIRDQETATTAIQAALTGHLVLSTLHTNDAPSSITRLINIGVEPFLVGAAVNGVLAQRLARRICAHCSQPEEPTPEIAELLTMHGINAGEIRHGKGCSRCRETGYSGRIGLYELLLLDDFLRDRIVGAPNVTEFRRICCERGMVTLRQDGFSKVVKGQTTVEEILRVTQSTI